MTALQTRRFANVSDGNGTGALEAETRRWTARLFMEMTGGIALDDETQSLPVLWANHLLHGQDLIPLATPLRIDVAPDPDDGGFVLHAAYARSAGAGETPEAAFRELSESIICLRAELDVEDDDLAPDAREMKRRLRVLFNETR